MVEAAKNYDVIIIGAGPAGGQCARELASLGRRVVLLERSQEIGEPNYSSAGTPRETVEEFDLPKSVLSADWNCIYMESSHERVDWLFPEVRGYVFDFMLLRKFLAEAAAHQGADIIVGAVATSLVEEASRIVGVRYRGLFGEGEVRAPFIVDASGHWGFANSVLHLNKTSVDDLASALELQVTAMPDGFEKTLAFFVGRAAPQGYGWVFPMEQGQAAKIGLGFVGSLPGQLELKDLLKKFMQRFGATKHIEPTEIHGGGGFISPGVLQHVHQNIVLVGDAAYQVNPLAYEGIRHALNAGRLAAHCLHEILDKPAEYGNLKEKYEAIWHHAFGWHWLVSYQVAKLIYQKFSDEDWDKLLAGFKSVTPQDAFEVFFNYRYQLLLKYPGLTALLGKKILMAH